jgi:signal transduction histidine kinase
MPEALRQFGQLAGSWRGDTVIAVAMLGWLLGYELYSGVPTDLVLTSALVALPFAGALVSRRRWPLVAAVAACGTLVAERAAGLSHALDSALAPFSWTPFLIAYSVGAEAELLLGLTASAALAAALTVENRNFNPFLIVIALGPWLAGRVVAARRALSEQLEARNTELESERELFIRESLRLERARIARELHDIVAHGLSVIVVQAGAAQRLATVDYQAAAESLRSIAALADSAQAEIARLVELIDCDPVAPNSTCLASPQLQSVGALVRQVGAAGQQVNLRRLTPADSLAATASQAAYRVVQEALTNALRHAPGAPVEVIISEAAGGVAVHIENDPPLSNLSGRRDGSGLELAGSGRGLAGLTDRVTSCGGTLTAGPTPTGGWLVCAVFPSAALSRRPGASTAGTA